MGYTFTAALVKKISATGDVPTAPSTRKAMMEGMEALGYQKAAPEDAALILPLYQHEESIWLSMPLEMPSDLEKEMEFLQKLAAEMHTSILYFLNFDSDLLFMAVTDGKAVQCTHIGFAEDDDLPPDSDDLSIFDALLPDDDARAEFRRIIGEEDRIFTEEVAQELAPLFGYTPEVLFTDEDTPVFAELAYNPPGAATTPFLMPADAPPCFTKEMAILSYGNPASMYIHSCGGAGKGIRVVMSAEDYDAEDWEAPRVYLTNAIMKNLGMPAEQEYEAKVQPKRCAFKDGGKGWIAEFPEAPIFQGVNPASLAARSARAEAHYKRSGYVLYLAFTGGTFHRALQEKPDAEMMRDEAKMQAWFRERQQLLHSNQEKTHIWVTPMENPEGSIHHSIPREPLKRSYGVRWLEDCLTEGTSEDQP